MTVRPLLPVPVYVDLWIHVRSHLLSISNYTIYRYKYIYNRSYCYVQEFCPCCPIANASDSERSGDVWMNECN